MRRLLAAVVGSALLAPTLVSAQERPAAVRIEEGVVFGTGGGRDLKLDLAMPAAGEGPLPAVVCIHGGGWVSGDRKQMRATIETLARYGFAAVALDYRLAPKDRFPAQIEDCKAAVRWLRANAGKYRINPGRIGAVGFSAGGHLACLLGVTAPKDGLEGKGGNAGESSRVQAVVSFFGPTDLTWRFWTKAAETTNFVPLFGGTVEEKPDDYHKASPLSYVGADDPPFLFFHGTDDSVVPVWQSVQCAKKLKGVGVAAEVVMVPGAGHGWREAKLLDSLARMVVFFQEKLKP